jgi:hypothetical protein
MTGKRTARFCHLHQAQHSFVHASATGGSDDDDSAALSSPIFNRARNFFADDRSHRRGKKAEIHNGDGDLMAVKDAVSADHSVEETGGFLIFFEAIFVARHSLETQNINGPQIGIHLHKGLGIEQIFEPLLSRLRKMIIATWTNALVLRELDFRHNFRTPGTFLEKTMRNIPLFLSLRFDCWFFENGHGNYARAAVAA